ncbi:hypothetical protein ABZ319_23395 [Nocardia sp. NPDC005978]|uniref:Rv0361 family membrane protein n=1 Tax=Nocardia sp. NPDC005978 TaxID=3156725 RepID=UPI0033B43028
MPGGQQSGGALAGAAGGAQLQKGPQDGGGQPQGPGGAPGFGGSQDATQVYKVAQDAGRVAPPQRIPGGGEVAPPQRIPAANADGGEDKASDKAGPNKKLLLIGAGVIVLVIAVIAAVIGLGGGGDDSPEGKVKQAIGTYTDALSDGDLDALRGITCGAQHDFYKNISAEQFAGVYQTSKEQKSIPVVRSVDAIRITGDAALAQATVYTEADPGKQSARTFDLQHTDDGWKVCDPPTGQQ